jgi:hypothetical protein
MIRSPGFAFEDLDVIVGRAADEAGQVRPFGHDADHVGGQPFVPAMRSVRGGLVAHAADRALSGSGRGLKSGSWVGYSLSVGGARLRA